VSYANQGYIHSFIYSFIHSFIHLGDLYSTSSRLLLRNAADPCAAKKNSFQARVESARMNPGGAIAALTEVHFTRKGQQPRMHGSALRKYGERDIIHTRHKYNCNIICII